MIIIVLFFGGCVIAGIVQYIINPKPPKGLKYTEYQHYYKNKEWQRYPEPIPDDIETDDINKLERIQILDETIVKYNRLLDSLQDLYNNTSDEQKRSIILSKQIATMEKLNRALEKLEKLNS